MAFQVGDVCEVDARQKCKIWCEGQIVDIIYPQDQDQESPSYLVRLSGCEEVDEFPMDGIRKIPTIEEYERQKEILGIKGADQFFHFTWTLLHLACRFSDFDFVKQVCEENLNVNINCQRETGETPFFIACWKNHINIVEYLLNYPNIDVNLSQINGITPFYSACHSDEALIQLLLNDPRVDLNIPDMNDSSPFLVSCFDGQVNLIKKLLFNPRVNIHSRNKFQQTGFLVACGQNHFSLVKELLKHPKIDINAHNIHQETPLLICCWEESLETVQLLMSDPRIDVTCLSKNNLSPLFCSVLRQNLQIMKWVLSSRTIIDVNLEYDHKKAIEYLQDPSMITLLSEYTENPKVVRDRLRRELKIGNF